MGVLHSTQHMAADVWQCVRGGRGAKEKWDRGRERLKGRERGKGTVGGGKRKMTKVKRERGGGGIGRKGVYIHEEEERWETERGGKRNGGEFKGSQTLCTPSTADATFCLAQWSVGLLYLYPRCVTSGPAQDSQRTNTYLASGFCSSPAMTKMRQVSNYRAPCNLRAYTETKQDIFSIYS